jgi:hypothetical protein
MDTSYNKVTTIRIKRLLIGIESYAKSSNAPIYRHSHYGHTCKDRDLITEQQSTLQDAHTRSRTYPMDTETYTTPDVMNIEKGGNLTDSDTLEPEEENTEVDPTMKRKRT